MGIFRQPLNQNPPPNLRRRNDSSFGGDLDLNDDDDDNDVFGFNSHSGSIFNSNNSSSNSSYGNSSNYRAGDRDYHDPAEGGGYDCGDDGD